MRISTLVLAIGCGLVATAIAERFDVKVRDDFFAGFTGDNSALERAMKVVREEKRQALLNVCLEVSYVKTS